MGVPQVVGLCGGNPGYGHTKHHFCVFKKVPHGVTGVLGCPREDAGSLRPLLGTGTNGNNGTPHHSQPPPRSAGTMNATQLHAEVPRNPNGYAPEDCETDRVLCGRGWTNTFIAELLGAPDTTKGGTIPAWSVHRTLLAEIGHPALAARVRSPGAQLHRILHRAQIEAQASTVPAPYPWAKQLRINGHVVAVCARDVVAGEQIVAFDNQGASVRAISECVLVWGGFSLVMLEPEVLGVLREAELRVFPGALREVVKRKSERRRGVGGGRRGAGPSLN